MTERGVNVVPKLAEQQQGILLGEGAFGKLYKETMNVAVKRIENFNKDAVKEVETLMKLKHKHIIRCYGYHLENNRSTLCITMEFADRGTFTKLITEEAQDPGSLWFRECNIWRTLQHICPGLLAHSASANPPPEPQARQHTCGDRS